MEKENNTQQLSKSQAKRAARKKEQAKQKKNDMIASLIVYGFITVIALILVIGIGSTIYKAATKVKSSSDYSAYLEDNGFIKGVNAASALDLVDYNSIQIPMSDVEYTDDEVEEEIESQLSSHQELSEEAVAQDNDKINIDFVGTVDGEEFEGGTAEGYDLTLGSHTFIDTFEEQLVGKKAGDTVDVNVTFPDDYTNEELAGKPAIFAVTVNGVYSNPEFDDAFVQEYLSENASTVDEYKQYLKDSNLQSNIEDWLETYLVDNTEVKSYPSRYLKNVTSTEMYNDEQSYEMMNQYYQSVMGQSPYSSFSAYIKDYMQMSDEEYQQDLKERGKDTAKEALLYQAILEKEGVTVTVDDVKAFTGDSYESEVETYGAGHVAQDYIKDKALKLVADKVKVN